MAVAYRLLEAAADVVISVGDPKDIALAQQIQTQVNTGVSQIETLAASITSANATTVRAQIVAVANAIKANISGLLTTAGVSPAENAKVTELVTAADALIDGIVAIFPPSTPAATFSAEQKAQVKVAVTNYKLRYNKIISTKTGDPKVDAALAKHHKFFVLGWKGIYPTFH